jgi:hypothetical protein
MYLDFSRPRSKLTTHNSLNFQPATAVITTTVLYVLAPLALFLALCTGTCVVGCNCLFVCLFDLWSEVCPFASGFARA